MRRAKGSLPCLWQRLMKHYLAFSDKSHYIEAEKGSHYIHLEQPELIGQALELIRGDED